jgi:hypothetical protein
MSPPTLQYTDSFFDIFFEVHIPGTGGERTVQHHVRGDIHPDQPIQLADVTVVSGPASSFDLFISVQAGGPVDPSLPLVTMLTRTTTITQGVDSFFDVVFQLEPDYVSAGTMEITRDSTEGGTFTSTLQVLPRISFVPVGGGPERVLPGLAPFAAQQTTPHPWRYQPYATTPPGAGPNFHASASPLQWQYLDDMIHTVQPALGPPCPIAVDFDTDTDVDVGDLEVFMACATGPSVPYTPESPPAGCTLTADDLGLIAADLDRDGDVDVSDFAGFQRCYSGEGIAADPHCGCR